MEITFTTSGGFEIEKAGDEQIVTAVAMVANVADAENDVVSPEELEKAAGAYLRDSRQIWLDHKTPLTGEAELLESFIAPTGFTINGSAVPKNAWVVKIKVLSKEIWRLIKSKVLRSLSVGGTAKAEETGSKRHLRDMKIREISLCEQGVVRDARILALKSEQSLAQYIETPEGLAQLKQIAAVVADLKQEAPRTPAPEDQAAKDQLARDKWMARENWPVYQSNQEYRRRLAQDADKIGQALREPAPDMNKTPRLF